MAWTDFYMDAGSGSNLNAGSTSGAAAYTSTAGNWDGTSVFTPTDGQTTSSLVGVGDWASVYPTGNSITPYVGQVTAVAAGANGAITLSTTAKFGTAPASGTGTRACKTGGAWLDLGLTASGGALNTGTVAQSTRINVKAGTYASTTTLRTLALAGTTTAPLWWRGYKSAIGDQDANAAAVEGTDIPLFTWTTSGLAVSGAYQRFSNLAFSDAFAGTLVVVTGANATFYRCRFTNTSSSSSARCVIGNATSLAMELCYLSATGSGIGANCIQGIQKFVACAFVGGSPGLGLTGVGGYLAASCVFAGQAGDAINSNGSWGDILGCSFYNVTGNGLNWSAVNASVTTVTNCHFEQIATAAKAAINNTTGTNTANILAAGNSYYNCTANASGITEAFAIYDDGTLASSGFTAPGSNDYTATTALKAIGIPGTLEKLNIVGYADNGALQRQEPAGGGTAIFSGEF